MLWLHQRKSQKMMNQSWMSLLGGTAGEIPVSDRWWQWDCFSVKRHTPVGWSEGRDHFFAKAAAIVDGCSVLYTDVKQSWLQTLYLVTSDKSIDYEKITAIYQKRWKVEEYHKSLKQNVNLSMSPTQTINGQTNHFFAALWGISDLAPNSIRVAKRGKMWKKGCNKKILDGYGNHRSSRPRASL